MKFNKLAKELNHSVSELADMVTDILPNANGGTDVSDTQKAQIIALLQAPSPDTALSVRFGDGTDPILSVLTERIEQESQRETPEQVVDQMIARYIANPEDLPADADYREAIITYVDLVKKRHARRQQQSSKLRSLLSRQEKHGSPAEPLALERFYSSGQSSTTANVSLGGNNPSPQLAATSS
ncbi:MAG: hypothetical protein AAF171_02030 [Cyanobacteria bacterium P01_A01_bin.116]